ncbi:HD domain-containing protein [Palleronia sp. KMU-117]|uniref:HD domain-containing protein n=1 Tax=Palleronia sp. KMU-117 TaxID=3434108 RepID=UPI003D731286
MMLTDRFGEALVFAEKSHREQVRKDTDIPYVAHLLAVASIVLEHGGDEDQAIAALLHDAVEDQGGDVMGLEIRDRFGERVYSIVMACTDATVIPKPPWRARKEAYIAAVPGKPSDALLVAMADKLHNAHAILEDHRRIGDAIWDRFNGGHEGTVWYYRSLADAFASLAPGDLAGRLKRAADEMAATLPARS